MKYFAVYMLKGLVVEICSFDSEAERDQSIKYFGNLTSWNQPFPFDAIQPFNQVI